MKHPPENAEHFEFNLGKAPNLRCVNSEVTVCNECECCRMRILLTETREWFPRAGEHTKRRFILGLVRRFHSVNLLQYVIMLLKPLIGKDYTYARSRTNPGIVGDRADMGCNRALRNTSVDNQIASLWDWFKDAQYWSKANYILGLLQFCDGNLLHTIGTQARTMLAAELKAAEGFNDDDDEKDETESLADTEYSYNTWDHPENAPLRLAAKEYSKLKESPLRTRVRSSESLDSEHVVVEDEGDENEVKGHDDDDSDSIESSDVSSPDPTLPIMPTARSAIGGIRSHVDFIRDLPIHISKYILSHLEYAQLVECFSVSRHWEHIAHSVEEDLRMRQILWEDVMLMQGSSAQGGNPVYASYVDVGVPELVGDSYDPLLSDTPPDEDVQFKSEINIHNSYSGYVTRETPMEERNVYCGAYNVMVLSDQEDFNRVVHYNFGGLVAVGSFDRHVRLVDIATGHEVGPLMTGHAGSVKCVYINEARGFVLSGSYDMSIRCWDIKTGKPKKIFHGHQDSILCMNMYEDILVSGAKDNEVKVWNFLSGKCFRTYKHAHQINTVAVYDDIVVSGCEGGKVKVWSIKNACLIKVFYRSPKQTNRFGFPNPHTHQGPITSVKLDQYHIVSGSRDGYAMVWSTQGTITKCISALRHPKEVLCVDISYLRLITGCEDGKLRVWNMLSGDCLRVLRGNSRSDPIDAIYPCGNSIVLLTVNNFLVLNFEEVQWDYTQEEKIELLRYKNHYGDAPLRKHKYAYVRAQRSERAGTANPKIIHHRAIQSAPSERSASSRQRQLPHSTRTLSARNIRSAKQTQKHVVNVQLTKNLKGSIYHNVQGTQPEEYDESMRAGIAQTLVISRGKGLASFTAGSRPPTAATHKPTYRNMISGTQNLRPHTAGVVRIVDSRPTTAKTRPMSSGTIQSNHRHTPGSRPPSGKVRHSSITSEAQLQTLGVVNPRSNGPLASSRPPTGIMKCSITMPSETSRPATAGTLKSHIGKRTKFQLPMRGHSAPVRRQATDALSLSEAKALMMSQRRTKNDPIPRDKLLLTINCIESAKLNTGLVNNTAANCLEIDYKPLPTESNNYTQIQNRNNSARSRTSDAGSVGRTASKAKPSEVVTRQTMVTPLEVKSHEVRGQESLHPKTIHSSIPRGTVMRPQSAHTIVTDQETVKDSMLRPPSRSSLRRSQSTGALPSSNNNNNTNPYIHVPARKKKTHGWSTSHTEAVVMVPMFMHGASRIEPNQPERSTSKTRISMPQRKVEDPLGPREDFQIRTRQQTQDYLTYVTGLQAKYEKDKKMAAERKQQQMWKAKASGKLIYGTGAKARVIAPEIGE
ncbi:F-box and WD repeat domain containing protein 10B-like isoform X2 [Amphiura filiformis]|uniref:F-box and WD repeat domain containing protein 10B-like isoform X2 n=1 Tax=Amphiura filiformis TaxID=82378 RepID=UPI003B20D9A8